MLSDEIMRDISKYTADTEKEILSAASKIQKEMLSQVTDNSPVRKSFYGKNPPGTLQRGWVNYTSKKDDAKIFAVRNKAAPKLVHLVNFSHEHFSHGRRAGTVTGTRFVTKAQEQGVKRLDDEIKKMLG